VPAYRCRHAELSRAFVSDRCRFFTVNLSERRNALRLLRPTALPHRPNADTICTAVFAQEKGLAVNGFAML
jgi:hypothetical protein